MSMVPGSTTRPIYTTRDGREESFHVPSLRVEVGQDQNNLVSIFDVSRVTYKDTVNQLDSIDFTVNDWNWEPTSPRYADDQETSFKLVLPGTWVRLWMGYQGPTGAYPMLTGRITTVTPTLSATGGATVSVRALSSLEAFRKVEHSVTWPKGKPPQPQRITDIAKDVAGQEFTIVTAPAYQVRESLETSVTQDNQTDIAFLISQAQRYGYIVLFRETVPPYTQRVWPRASASQPRPEKVVYFGPSSLLGDNERRQLGEEGTPFDLHWGRSLIDFRPTVTVSSTLWKQVRFSFWNRDTKKTEPLTYALKEDLWPDEHDLNRDLEWMLPWDAMAVHQLTDIPAHTVDQARAVARNMLRENFLQLVTADGTTVGLPELRAGCRVRVTGIGWPLEGYYFVTGTTHTIDDSGYRTSFTAHREQMRGDT